MITVWFLGIMLNGLPFLSLEPFHSEEACELAAKVVQAPKYQCIEQVLPTPSTGKEPTE